MKIILSLILLMFSYFVSILSNSVHCQSLVNNPCNLGSTVDWPMDGTCYSADKVTAFTNLFTPLQCGATSKDDGWASFTGNGYELTIEYTPVSRDAIIHLYSAISPCSITYINCSNSGGNGVTETIVLPSSVNGQKYFIRVERKNSNNSMIGCMSIGFNPPPPPAADPLLRLSLSGLGNSTELIVRFKPDATSDYDISYDAVLFPSGDPLGIDFASVSSDNYNLVINSLGNTNLDVIVPLYTYIGTNGSYSIEMTEFNEFPNNYSVVLHDHKLGVDHLLNNSPYIFTADVNDGYYRFEINGFNAPLPVQLLNFNANLKGDMINLFWSTLTEINNDYFTIEKSSDGINFHKITNLPGSGNSQSISYYSFIDYNPNLGINYYRLVQTDFNNKQEYIGIDQVNYIPDIRVSLFPNPVVSDMWLNFQKTTAESDVLIEINNINGLNLSKQKIRLENSNRLFKIETNKLASGMYYINLIYNDQIRSLRFLKIDNH